MNYVIILPCVKGLAYLRQHNLHLGRLVWLGATLAIMVLALVAPLSAATLSRRARAVHARSHLSRGVQTSRLGISADAIEGGVIRGLSSVGLSGARRCDCGHLLSGRVQTSTSRGPVASPAG